MDKKEKILYKILSSVWNFDELTEDDELVRGPMKTKIEQLYNFFDRHFFEDLKTLGEDRKTIRVLEQLDSFGGICESPSLENLGLMYAKLKSAHQDILSLERDVHYKLVFDPLEVRLRTLLTKPIFKKQLIVPPPLIERVDRNCYY
jgi:hypothetical protein